MLVQVLYFILGLGALYYGAEFSLESAEKIGKKFKMSPLLIGLFIVGFGTSLPEFFVSQVAGINGKFDMSLGNIVGSNAANIFLVLGVCGFFVDLKTDNEDLKFQFLFHLVVTLTCGIIFYFKKVNLITLGVFFGLFIYYFLKNFKSNKSKDHDEQEIHVGAKEYALLVLGFSFLYGGGEILIYSGSHLSRSLNISEYTISAILVAFGTSFPELVTSLIACRKKKDTDLIIGNVIGSNIFNLCFVLGSVGVYSFSLKSSYLLEMMILLAISILFVLGAKGQKKIGRFVSSIFLMIYFGLSYYWVSYS